MFHLYTPWKNKKTCDFLMFSGGMGLKIGLKPFYDKFIIYHSQVTIQLCENTFYNVKNRSTRRKWDIRSKLIIKTPERRHWRRYGAFIASFAHSTPYSSVPSAGCKGKCCYKGFPWHYLLCQMPPSPGHFRTIWLRYTKYITNSWDGCLEV